MKKIYRILGIIIGIIILLMIFLFINQNKKVDRSSPLSRDTAVNVVTEFGKNIQKVSLTADEKVIKKTIKDEYSEYVSKELLNKWLDMPASAPGRETSSPWPDHIEITEIRQVGDEYQINGNIIYKTSVEVENGGNVGIRQISAIVYMFQGKALINDFMVSEEIDTNASTTIKETE